MIVEPCKILEVNFTNDHVYVPLVVNTSRLTRRMQLVEQELLTLPEHLNSILFLLVILLSVLLRYTDSDYSFGIFKLFFPTQKRQSLPQSYWSLPSDSSVEEIAKTWKNCIMLESSRKLLGILK